MATVSKTSTGADSPRPQIPVDAIDDMLNHVAQAADDLGLRPGDRLYPICSSLMMLCRTLATSIQTNHDAHARAIASNQDKLLASLETALRHLELQTDRLQRRAQEQIRQVEDHFAEMKKQRVEILDRYSIESEGEKFFKKLDAVNGINVNEIGRITRNQIEALEKASGEIKGHISTSIRAIPRNLSQAIADKMGDTDVIAKFVSQTLTQQVVKAVVDRILGITSIGITAIFIVFSIILFYNLGKQLGSTPIPTPTSKNSSLRPW